MLIPFLKNFYKKDVVGFDIGRSGVKCARLNRDGSMSHWLFEGNCFEQEAKFRAFVDSKKLKGCWATCNVEDASLKIRKVDLPKMPAYDLREAVRWQLREIVEGAVTDYVVRHSLIEEYRSGEMSKLSLMAYAVKKKEIDRRKDFFKRCGLKLVAAEPLSVSLLALFQRLQKFESSEFYGLIELGESKSVFTVMGEGKLYFSRPLTGVSGTDLKGMLEQELSLASPVSDALKNYLMNMPVTDEIPAEAKVTAIGNVLPSFHARLAIETQRSIDAFALMFRREKINRLFLSGGGAGLNGLQEYFAVNLGVPTEVLNSSSAFPIPIELAPLFNGAVGLALYPV